MCVGSRLGPTRCIDTFLPGGSRTENPRAALFGMAIRLRLPKGDMICFAMSEVPTSMWGSQ
jgi:hypothetical protein